MLDDLPDEYHITGQLIDEKDNSAILFVEIYVLIDGKEFAKGGTDKSGNFRLVFQRKNMTAAAAKKILGGDIDFTIKLWGKDLSKFDFRDNFPVPIIEFIESQGFRYFHKDTIEFENQILLAYNRDISGEALQYNLFAKTAKSGKKVATIPLGQRKVSIGKSLFLRFNFFAKNTDKNKRDIYLHDWQVCPKVETEKKPCKQ